MRFSYVIILETMALKIHHYENIKSTFTFDLVRRWFNHRSLFHLIISETFNMYKRHVEALKQNVKTEGVTEGVISLKVNLYLWLASNK